jgi:tripartite-type tricarboxylate transporter receptor subunit TctC
VPYDPIRDLTPVIAAVEAASLVAVHPSVPVNNMRELVDFAKQHPGELAYGHTGVGSYFHLSVEALKSFAGIDMLGVPYKGMPPMVNDLAGGRIQFAFGAVSSLAPQMSRIRVIATVEPKRLATMPNVPTVAESLPGYEKVPTWYAFFGPAGLARPIQMRLNAELQKALDASDVRKWIDDNGMVPIGGPPEHLAALHRTGMEVYGRIIKQVGIKPE